VKFLIALREFFWPWLDRLSTDEIKKQEERRKNDRVRIDKLNLRRDGDVALDEARRMADSEAERRRGTDQKAATYLPLVAALVPLILTVVSALWDKKAGSAPGWLNMPLLGLAVAYTAAAGLWAFRVLEVTISHEAGLGDFELVWSKPRPAQAFARRILLYTRLNQDRINWKVSCIKMAHAFLLRAFITFSLLLIINIVWYLAILLWQTIWPGPDPVLATPQRAIAAVASVDRLAGRLRTADAWTVLDQDCREHLGGRDTLHLVAGAPTSVTELPVVLKPSPSDRGVVRDIRLICAGRDIGQMRAWFLPNRLSKPQRASALPHPLDAPATAMVVALKQDWPPAGLKGVSTILPTTLIRQTVLLRGSDGRSVAMIVTNIGPGALATR
jgi:hypothetical protein